MTKYLLALALLVGLGGLAHADELACPPGQSLRILGSIKSGTTDFGVSATADGGTVTTDGAKVRRIVVACGGTACTNFGIANKDQIGAAVKGDYVLDPTVAANTTLTLDFMDTPLDFSTGVSMGDTSGNVSAVSVFACQSN